MKKRRAWTNTENDYLRRVYADQSSIDIATTLGRGLSSVYVQAQKLGLTKSAAYRRSQQKRVVRNPWTDEDNDYLRRTYADHFARDIARRIGRSVTSVHAQARKLGLKKDETFVVTHCRLQKGAHIGVEFQFKPGQAPANKGLRRPGYSKGRGRMEETQFKKGTRPPNTLPVGTIKPNADGYLRIKISDAPELPGAKGANSPNWEFVHKRVWEAAHGPIPPGHRIWWKDGNHLNCALENLELLTDKEHMARTTVHNLPPDLREVINLKGALKRAIRRKAKEHGGEESTTRPA
jgi:hypothetical protein